MPSQPWFYVRRGPSRTRKVKVLVDPNHIRFRFSIHDQIKRDLEEEHRYALAEALGRHFDKALTCTADNPMEVTVKGDLFRGKVYRLCRNPNKPEKVLVRY